LATGDLLARGVPLAGAELGARMIPGNAR